MSKEKKTELTTDELRELFRAAISIEIKDFVTPLLERIDELEKKVAELTNP